MTTQLNEIIGKITKISKAIKACRAIEAWQGAVGEGVSKNSEAISVKKGTLFVEVKNSAWAQELSMLKPEIIRKINEKTGEKTISDLRFRVKGQ